MVSVKIWTNIVVFIAALGVIYKVPSGLYNTIGSDTHVRKYPAPDFMDIIDRRKYSTLKHCSYPFYIFIYPLPTIFNAQVIPYVETLAESAFHSQTNYNESTGTIFDGTYNMLQFNTEILMHWLLAKHPCVTLDPEKASFFYLPVYAFYMYLFGERRRLKKVFWEPLDLLDNMLRNSTNVDAFYQYVDRQAILERQLILQFRNRSKDILHSITQLYAGLPATRHSRPYPLPLHLVHTLPSTFKSYLYRNQLCDHIFVASRPFFGSNRHYIWQANTDSGIQHNIIWLAIEVSPRYPLYRYTLPKLTKNIAIPYVVSGELHEAGDLIYQELHNRLIDLGIDNRHIQPCRVFCSENSSKKVLQDHLKRVGNSSFARPLLSYFAGSTISSRMHLKTLLSTMKTSVFQVIRHDDPQIDRQLLFMYLKSTFCFVLPGDSNSTKRLFDIIAGNCIPVIISDSWELPFAHLPWNTFSLRFSQVELINNKSFIRSALTSMPVKQILSMQISLYNNRHHFLYPLEKQEYMTQEGDALDNIFQELNARLQYAKTCEYYS